MRTIPEIPGYNIEKEIGRGGMSCIYLAVDRIADRKVALKVFVPSFANEKEAKSRFISEGEILSKLNHKNIVPVYDIGDYGGVNYIAVEFLEGKSLKDRIHPKEGARIGVKESLSVVRDIAEALSYSHKMGLIHRDIKPENILFRNDNTPVLVDFGIAKDFSAGKNFTMTGTSIGTPYYMSPEQIKGFPPDGRNDIYSLGVVLYEMLTGKIPYKGSDIITVALKHERDPLPKLPKKLAYLQDLLNMMMAKKSEDRPAGGKELIDLLDSFEESELSFKKKGIDFIRIQKFFLGLLFFFIIFIIPVSINFYVNNTENYKKITEEKVVKKSIKIPRKKVHKRRKILPEIPLRSKSRIISVESLERIIKKYNYYDDNINPMGSFNNRFKTKVIRRNKVVIDIKTGLMWHQRGSFKSMGINKAKKWIKVLNRSRFGGFADWRLPTVDEGASLLEKKKWYGNLHIFSVFSVVQKEIWTSDRIGRKKSNWIVSFKKGRIRSVSLFKKRAFVRPVRKVISN